MDIDKYRTPAVAGPACLVGRTLNSLDADRAAFLRRLLSDPDVIWAKLEEHSIEDFGMRIPAGTASRHARGRCACD